jgi:putative membrane protein
MTYGKAPLLPLALWAVACVHEVPPSPPPSPPPSIAAATPTPPRAVPQPMTVRTQSALSDPVREGHIPISPEVDQVNPAEAPVAPAMAIAGSEALDDEKILRIAHVAAENEIEAAKLAVTHARDPRVRRLARTIVKDGAEADERGERVARMEKIDPRESDLSAKLEEESRWHLDELAEKTGAEFDRAFLAAQAAAHRDVLQLIDVHLIPGATSPPIKNLVRSMRPEVAKRYEEVRALQTKLKEK